MTHGRTLRAAFSLSLASLLCAAGPAQAGDLAFDLSDSAARADFMFAIPSTELTGDAGFLHDDNDGDVIFGGIQLVDDAGQGAEPFTVGLGLRAVNVDANTVDGMALAIGGFFNYVFPDYNRFAVAGYLYFAPSVTSFNDLDQYLEYGIRGDYRILKKASVYVGIRQVKADFATGVDSTIGDGLHVGISLKF